jgi:SAM-dependent MidA family methyltransferase
VVSLSEIIIEKIKKDGPLSFHDFMEMALYYPGAGYYTSAGDKIGTSGDFYTSPCYTSLFGQMIAHQVEEMWNLLGKNAFTILEYGAGTGIMSRDILAELQHNTPLYKDLRYVIIEKSNIMQQRQKELLPSNVHWYNNATDVPAFTGCIISNEVVDNFSVHRVVMQKELMEIQVTYNNGFAETLVPASPELKEYLSEMNIVLPEGFQTEINLEVIKWVEGLANMLKKGFVLTIDYGYPATELYHESRREGTLTCYHRHKVNSCPYEHIGEQDITSHVNFSALHHWGTKNGLTLNGYTNQAYFLMGLGLSTFARQKKIGSYSPGNLHQFLVDMGSKFKILAQQKGIPPNMLSGFRFCQSLR